MATEYFKNSYDLENVQSFLPIANDIYLSWIAADDPIAKSLNEIEFQVAPISIDKFVTFCERENTIRLQDGRNLKFRDYAVEKISKIFYDDWNNFSDSVRNIGKVNQKQKEQVLGELYKIKSVVNSIPYFTIINNKLQETLNDVESKFNLLFELNQLPTESGNSRTYLKWNGEESQILTLLKLLIINNVPSTNKMYIENDFTQMKKFVKDNFLNSKGEPFGDENLNKYLKINGRISPRELPIVEIVRYGTRQEKNKEDI